MKHLDVDEIIRFVSLNKINRETVEFAAYVNGHIRKCPQCLALVQSFQTIYDEFSRLDKSGDFKEYAATVALKEKEQNSNFR